jgi:hypothetical protein
VRRPTAILIDRESQTEVVRQPHHPFAGRQVERERLLRKHMLSRPQRRLDDRRAHVGVRGDINHAHIVTCEQLLPVGVDCGIGKEFRSARFRPLP